MKIAIIGANGYIGRRLIQRLLAETEHAIVAMSLHAEEIPVSHPRLTKKNTDVFDTLTLQANLEGCHFAYYLVHMMAQKQRDFAEAETEAAENFVAACTAVNIKSVVYLGGLGDDKTTLSKHLASRHKTGKILRTGLPRVIEFRASMVVGTGSISYDIITNLIHKLPVLTLPKWAKTLTQPIGLEDAISYLIAAIALPGTGSEVVEIGGPEQLSYGDLMKRYADWEHKKMLIVRLYVIPLAVAAWWLNLFTPKTHAKVGRVMVESLSNPMVVTNDLAGELFPGINPKPLEDTFV